MNSSDAADKNRRQPQRMCEICGNLCTCLHRLPRFSLIHESTSAGAHGFGFMALVRFFHLKEILAALVLASCAVPAPAAPPPDQIEFFEKKIRPVLVAECYECHADEKKKGGLQLDSRARMLAGGDTGPAIVP